MSVSSLSCVENNFQDFIKIMDHCCYQTNFQSGVSFSSPGDPPPEFAGVQTKKTSCEESLGGLNNSSFPIRNDDSKTKAMKEVNDVVKFLLSKHLNQDPFYLIFDEDLSNKNKDNCNNNNENVNDTSLDLTSSVMSDLSMRKGRILTDSQSSNESQSVFGSPLKLPAIADLSAVDKNFKTSTPTLPNKRSNNFKLQGLSLQQARLILRRFCLNGLNNEKKSLLNAVVILCDGEDAKKTILIGALKEEDGGKRVLRTFCATQKYNQRVKLSTLQPSYPDKAGEYHMSADYEMLDKRETQGFMLLQAQWTDQHGSPRISNSRSAKFHLKLAAVTGCSDSPMYPYCKQLEDVILLSKALQDNDTSLCIKKKTDFDAVQNLQQLFVRIKKGDETYMMAMSCDHGKKINLSPERDSDFTDKVWTIIQQCSSYDDMLKCLNITMKALKNRAMSVYVHKDNQTILAQLARQSSLGVASFPPLLGGLPLKIIVEIGLEKIKRDYCAVLLENRLCSSHDLESFIKECQKDDDNVDASYNVEALNSSELEMVQKLHHCLELVCMMDTFSENLDMKSLVNLMMINYKTHKLDEARTFTLPVMANQAILEIKNASACLVRREFESGSDCTVDCYMSELPESLSFPVCLPSDGSDALSSTLNESREFYAFQTKENVKILGGSSKK